MYSTNQELAKHVSYRTIRGNRILLSYAFLKLAIMMILFPKGLYRIPLDQYSKIDIPAATVLDALSLARYAFWHLVHGFTMIYRDKLVPPSQWHVAHRGAKTQYDSLASWKPHHW